MAPQNFKIFKSELLSYLYDSNSREKYENVYKEGPILHIFGSKIILLFVKILSYMGSYRRQKKCVVDVMTWVVNTKRLFLDVRGPILHIFGSKINM